MFLIRFSALCRNPPVGQSSNYPRLKPTQDEQVINTHALWRTRERVLVAEVAARCLVRLLFEQIGDGVLGAVAVHDLLRGVGVRAGDERPSGVPEVAALGQLLDRLAHLVVARLVHQRVAVVRRQITAKNEHN